MYPVGLNFFFNVSIQLFLNYSFCVYFYLPHRPYFSNFHSRIPISFEVLLLDVLLSHCLSLFVNFFLFPVSPLL